MPAAAYFERPTNWLPGGGDMWQNVRTAMAVAAGLLLAPTGAQAAPRDISYPVFADSAGLSLTGTAAVTGGVLRLTSGSRDQAGAAWSRTTLDPRAGFDTTFDVTTSGPDVHADGFAFVVQSDGSRAI